MSSRAPRWTSLFCRVHEPRANRGWRDGSSLSSLTPGDVLHEENVENILVSASRSQASIVLEFARSGDGSDDTGVRWRADGAEHLATSSESQGDIE